MSQISGSADWLSRGRGMPVKRKETMNMKCPHCEKEIAGSPCPNCGEATGFDAANYCVACGHPLKEDLARVATGDDAADEDSGFDLEDRVLCPDGTCTGIIIEGRCSECGRAVSDDGEFIEPDRATAMAGKPSEGVSEGRTAG